MMQTRIPLMMLGLVFAAVVCHASPASPTAPHAAPALLESASAAPQVVPGQIVGSQTPPSLPPRDQAPIDARSAARLTGQVVAAEGGTPLRRVLVRIYGEALRESRSALTDADGRYELADLPPGRYQLQASKGGYVTIQHGQRSPLDAGRHVTLRPGETLERVDFILPRGSVITGTIVDEFGEPVADAFVTAARRRFIGGSYRQIPAGRPASSNDLGQYRIFGLPPGDYLLSAAVRGDDATTMGVQGGAPTGYAPTYFPGTPSAQTATPVRVGLGTEATADFTLIPTPTVRVSGTVVDTSGEPVSTAFVRLLASDEDGLQHGGLGAFVGAGTGIRAGGAFSLEGVIPGSYQLLAQSQGGPGRGDRQMAILPLSVGTAPMEGLTIVLTKGASIGGEIVIDGDDTALRRSTFQVAAQAAEPTLGMAPAVVNDDLTFELRGLHGHVHVRFTGLLPPGWFVSSITYDGREIIDSGFDAPRSREDRPLRITLSDAAAALSGTVTDDEGRRLVDYSVIVFPDDEAKWRLRQNRYVRSARPDQDGTFTLQNMPDGRYLLLATESPIEDWQDPAVLESLSEHATPVTLRPRDTRVVEIRLPSR